ncbi:MAG TPA: hypothetical protein VEL73_09505 [Mycobacteriales bacterium]|nr:hypothetical protein [Mycobacteriales bacterium]
MLLERRSRDGILDGSITMLFRRWRRPQVVAGRTYRTTAGLLIVHAVDVVDPGALGEDDVRAAGYASADEVRADLRGDPGDPVYRLRVRRATGPDQRELLAGQRELTAEDAAELRRRLDRLDRASSHGSWTAAVLDAIAANPGRRAGDLADSFGRELQPFKVDVRKLKALGLTHSLEIGYRLSPRGEAYLRLSRSGRPAGG